jgi:hypothetical protein
MQPKLLTRQQCLDAGHRGWPCKIQVAEIKLNLVLKGGWIEHPTPCQREHVEKPEVRWKTKGHQPSIPYHSASHRGKATTANTAGCNIAFVL